MLSKNNIVAFVPIRDAERARAFYEQSLGLTFVKDDGFALVFDANGVMLRLAKVKEVTPAPFTVLGWEVGNIETAAASLRDKNVAFERYSWADQDDMAIWTAPDKSARVAWFKDPDGNTLSISQHM